LKPWNKIPIYDSGEKIVSVPSTIKLIDPHPYLKSGAPYKNKDLIWALRETVLLKLINADNYLKSNYKDLSLMLYDSWRPMEVQEYMYNSAINAEYQKLKINSDEDKLKLSEEVCKKVGKFWAYPTQNPACPPPHSTGAAIDATLINSNGKVIFMGSNFDEMSPRSSPDFYQKNNSREALLWKNRRQILKTVLMKFGFVQHPHEWWHFSYGDQLWAWKKQKPNALYGRVSY
tara:strand:+ start:1709 stop:2401 length:693 start_codon:yes stop_codon:yes gene_type:complete